MQIIHYEVGDDHSVAVRGELEKIDAKKKRRIGKMRVVQLPIAPFR
jgi:hypothetical protein